MGRLGCERWWCYTAGAAVLPAPIALTAGTAAFVSIGAILGGASGFVEEEVTITRMVGMVSAGIRTDTTSATASVAIGCGVFTGEALSAGIASLPSPEDRPDFEWLYYNVFPLWNPLALDGSSNGRGINISFDVKGQRIMRAGQTVAWIAESQGQAAFAGVGGRYLVKLT